MREMVLNHASVVAPDRHTLLTRLLEMTSGMVSLNQLGVADSALRMSRYMHDISCANGITLWDAIQDLQRQGAREEFVYLVQLSSKVPLLDTVGDSAKDRFLRSEVTGFDVIDLSPEDGAPLLYCAITDGVAVGFPSDPIWEQDQIDVYFNELSSDGEELDEVAETIDNLTSSEHAETIFQRHQAYRRTDISNFKELWEHRDEAFPNLIFGPDVERQLERINTSALRAIEKKLSILDRDAAKWRDVESSMPEWSCKVRPESKSVRDNSSFIEARRFRSTNGKSEIFEWHADFGYDRIHLRFDAPTKEVEIGYIGKHLPLPPQSRKS